MVSTYHGVETATRATQYFRKGMEIAGVNMAKSDTAGYSRQVVNAQATPGLVTSPNISYLGTGVQITNIERMRDQFLDAQMRRATVEQAYWQTMLDGITRIDSFIVNTNSVGLGNLLDEFWASLQGVHTHSGDASVRDVFLKSADTLALFAQSLSGEYTKYRNELNDDIRAMVEEANSLIDQIAILNKGISSVRNVGGEPNELLDQRDLLTNQLCRLTGAESSISIDEADGDYKINLNGMLLVQGSNVRHLILVENPANNNYYEVQVEHNQYDITSDPDVAQVIIERRADDNREAGSGCTTDGVHELEVLRMADELFWTVGYGTGQSDGGDRIDGIYDPDLTLGISGSFALQVGSGGVRVYSEVFDKTPPGEGNILGELGVGESSKHMFRIASGDFETTITLEWDDVNDGWIISDNLGNSAGPTSGPLSAQELADFINTSYPDSGIEVKFTDPNNPMEMIIESTDRQLMSITDVTGDLMSKCGMANGNPIVMIEVTPEDTLQTIANKINNAYNFDNENAEKKYTTSPPDTMPSSPEEWLHASVEPDGAGGYFLCLTSNVAGEENRINVMSGSVCGGDVYDMTVARRLGLIAEVAGTPAQRDVTNYIQMDRANEKVITRDTGDVFVDDAYVRLDGVEYLTSSNAFYEAKRINDVGNTPGETLNEMSPGIRFFLQDVGSTTILVRHPLLAGEIFANIKLRDDVILGQLDTFDDMMYKLATEFNAAHYAGYGTDDYANTTGMAFFDVITNKYGAFGQLATDPLIAFDQSRLAAASGDGKGASLGNSDGSNALKMAQLKQAKIFMNGTGNFDDLYRNFVADVGSFGQRSLDAVNVQNHVIEQLDNMIQMVSGVNTSEETLKIMEFTGNFNSASQYLSTIFQVINQIITGVGRVGI